MLSLFTGEATPEEKPGPGGPGYADGEAAAAAKAVEERCTRQLEELRTTTERTEDVVLGLRDQIYGKGWEDPGLKAAISAVRYDVEQLKQAMAGQVEPLMKAVQSQLSGYFEQRFAQVEQQIVEAMQLHSRLAEAAGESHAHALQVCFRADAKEALLEEAAANAGRGGGGGGGGMSNEEREALEARLRALEESSRIPAAMPDQDAVLARLKALESALEEGIEMGMGRVPSMSGKDGKSLGMQVRQAVLEINMLDERLAALEASGAPQEMPAQVEARMAALEEKVAPLAELSEGGDIVTVLRQRVLALSGEQQDQESRVTKIQDQVEQMRSRLQAAVARTTESSRKSQDIEQHVEHLSGEVKRLAECGSPLPGAACPEAELKFPSTPQGQPQDPPPAQNGGGGGAVGEERLKQFLQAQLAESTALRGRLEASIGDRLSKAMEFIRGEHKSRGEESRRAQERLHARVQAVETRVEEEYMRRLELLRMQFAETAFLRQKVAQASTGPDQDVLEGYLSSLSRTAERAVLAEVVEAWRSSCKQQPPRGTAG